MVAFFKRHFSQIIFVLVAIFTGVIAGGYASMFVFAEKILRHILAYSIYAYFALGFLFLIVSWLLVYFFSPEAKGSGIPQVLYSLKLDDSELESSNAYSGIKIRTAIIKIFSSFVCLLGGGAIGREGPTIQIGACLFWGLSKKVNKYIKIENTIPAKAWIVADRFSHFKNGVLLAIIVAGMAAVLLNGSYLYLGIPQVITGGSSSFICVLIVVIITSFSGTLFGYLLKKVVTFRKRFTSFKSLFFVAILFSAILIISTSLVSHQVIGSGKEMILDIL